MWSIALATLFSILQAVSHSAASIVTSSTWSAAIYHISAENSSYKCSGTVINNATILTTAQCVFESNQQIFPEKLLLQLGKHKLKVFEPNNQAFQIHEIIPHPKYNSTTFENDIAIIRLSNEAASTDYVQPICLWESNRAALSEVINKMGTVSGWEKAKTDSLSINLQHDVIPVVSSTTCLRSNPNFFGTYLSDRSFCAGFQNGNSSCNFDIGGSMTFEENGVHRIRGIVSTSATRQYNICSTEYVIFTDVAQYLTWINDVVPELKCSEHSGLASTATTTIIPKNAPQLVTLPKLTTTTATHTLRRLVGQEYQGCYRDKKHRAYINKINLPHGTNTVYGCAKKCYENHFKYTATEYGNECFCGNTLPNPVKHPMIENSHCDRECTGNRSEICGGRWALSVYTTGL